ncbi:DUF3265 domain-containing protein [Vibrio vulnificus]|nr:DUF3265 domain-containing protein [Vibrio vulnificus]
MTRRLSGIHAAWHFWFTASFGGESRLREVGLCGTHPLTQRYVFYLNRSFSIVLRNNHSSLSY